MWNATESEAWQAALFNITTLISTLGDYPRAPRSHAAYSNQAHSTKPPLLGPLLSYPRWLVLCCSIYGGVLAGVLLSAPCDSSLCFSGLRWRESVSMIECISILCNNVLSTLDWKCVFYSVYESPLLYIRRKLAGACCPCWLDKQVNNILKGM